MPTTDAKVVSPLDWISDYFQNEGYLCGDCQWCDSRQERHGPGLGEWMSNCEIVEGKEGDPNECPAYAARGETT